MKIYALLLVKNEVDIIHLCLQSACQWCDKVIVIDNGSTDGTWEEIQQFSQRDAKVVPFLRYEGAFRIGLRAKAFHVFRHEMSCGDWWCVRMDADELYQGNVRQFLQRVPKRYCTVKKESTDYILTEEDLHTLPFEQGFEAVLPHIKHTLATKRQERRFMRHRPWYLWNEHWRYPHPWGRVFPTPIAVKHYQYRSPKQMQKRFATRQQAKADGCGSFKHERGASWKDYIPQEETLLKQGRNTVKIVGGTTVVKEFPTPIWWRRIIYTFFRKSKARRSYEYALRLPKGITPSPISYHENYRGGLLADSNYICALSECTHTFKDLRDTAFPQREAILAEIGRFTARLHEQGILHTDYSQGNILFSHQPKSEPEWHIEIVDLNRLRFRKHITIQQGCRNFERLDIDSVALDIMAKAYAETRGMDIAQCTQLVHKYRWYKK